MAATTDKWVHDQLEKESFQAHHAYYKQYLHNHIAHGIVALARLGASQEDIVKNLDYMVERYFVNIIKASANKNAILIFAF